MKQFLLLFLTSILFSQNPNGEKLSNKTALKSLLLPGWGNYSAGNKTAAYVHFTTEISLWLGYFYNHNLYENSKLDYQNFALSRLAIPKRSYSDSYYKAIASYLSYDDYIEFQRRQGKSIASDISEEYRWSWASKEERIQFASKRIDAIEFEKDLKFWFYGMALNRIISYFLARRDIKAYNLSLFSTADFNPVSGNKLSLIARFEF